MNANIQSILLIVVGCVVSCGLFLLGYYFIAVSTFRRSLMSDLSNPTDTNESKASTKKLRKSEIRAMTAEKILKIAGIRKPLHPRDSVSSRLYKAGYFSSLDRRVFYLIQAVCLLVGAILIPFAFYIYSNDLLMSFGIFLAAGTVGWILPQYVLDKKIQFQEDEILYYLPLVIEQISIAIGSSLVVGTAISHIVKTAEDRNVYNPVVELFAQAQDLMRSGYSLEQSLSSISELVKIPEVEHCFMFLSQCSLHGGEISRQLQELANSISTEHHIRIQGKIQGLPVKATGPLGMVFAGFFCMALSGLAVQLLTLFS